MMPRFRSPCSENRNSVYVCVLLIDHFHRIMIMNGQYMRRVLYLRFWGREDIPESKGFISCSCHNRLPRIQENCFDAEDTQQHNK